MDPISLRDKEAIIPILQHPFSLGTVLHSIAYRLWEEEIYTWQPETLGLEFKDEFGFELPPANQNKLNSLISAVVGHGFYTDWAAFLFICQLLSNNDDPMEGGDPLLASEMAWGVIEVKLNDDKPHPWSAEVKRMAGKILETEGFTSAPKILSFADFGYHYHGSDSPGDTGKAETLTTEHAQVLSEYVQEQSLLLIRQISALPWHNEHTLEKLVMELREDQVLS